MTLTFPPLMYGEAVGADPFAHATLKAIQGCDAGMVAHCLKPNQMQGAMVFAPEVALQDAVAMLPVCGIGFQNALGALAPPEVAVHLEWEGGIRINGARCGQLRMAASTADASAVPEWLVVGLDLPLWPDDGSDGGETPDETTLYAEGCVDVAADHLMEAWARHTLRCIGHWESEGVRPIHTDWRALAYGVGEGLECRGQSGTFVGIDDRFGMLLRIGEEMKLIPLTEVLETT